MAQAETKSRITKDPSARSVYATEIKKLSDGYGTWKEEVRTLESDLTKAALVGSKNGFQMHLPVLDIDGKVALSIGGSHVALWVDAPGSMWALHRLRKVLERTGISPKAVREQEHPQLAYSRDRDLTVDTRAVTQHLLKARVGFTGSYDELLRREVRTSEETPFVLGPPMYHPYRIPLQVPALLVDSTSNHHLYLERALSWTDYRDLLKALKRAGIIEKGFCDLSILRGESFLRLPWVSKNI
jgi:hypothetical protein